MGEIGAKSDLLLALRGVMLAADSLRLASARGLLGMGNSDILVLSRLAIEGANSPSELGAQLRLTSSAMTALVDRLVAENLAGRIPHPRDRRKILVTLTDVGARAMEQYLGQLNAVIERSAANLSQQERAVVLEFLRDAAAGLAELPEPTLQKVIVDRDSDGRLTLGLAGELDVDSVEPLRVRLGELIAGSDGQVILDVKRVDLPAQRRHPTAGRESELGARTGVPACRAGQSQRLGAAARRAR